MNRVLLILNVVLLLALAYLYFAFFTEVRDPQPRHTQADSSAKTNIKIAFFDFDTLVKKYEYAKEINEYLQGKNNAMEAKLDRLKKDFSSKLNDYQKRGASLSQMEQTQMQEELGHMQNNLDQQQQSLGQEMQSEYTQKMFDLKTRIQNFLKTYAQQKGYEYVFATSSDENLIFYKDSVRNITSDIVAQLNQQYQETKKK